MDFLNGIKVYVLAAIEHVTRRIRILGATEKLVQVWVVQQARNLLMDLEEPGTRVRFVIHDRDASFAVAFDEAFRADGTRVIRSAVQAPRMNSIMERWIGSCHREVLDRTVVWDHRHLTGFRRLQVMRCSLLQVQSGAYSSSTVINHGPATTARSCQTRTIALPENPILLRIYRTGRDSAARAEASFHRLLDAADHSRTVGKAPDKSGSSTRSPRL